jgi:hypothetical protein
MPERTRRPCQIGSFGDESLDQVDHGQRSLGGLPGQQRRVVLEDAGIALVAAVVFAVVG